MDRYRNPNGTYNGAAMLADLAGTTVTDVQKLAEKVRQDIAKLEACERHRFEPIGPIQPLRTRYLCLVCGGQVDSHAVYWYERGLVHGGGC